VVVLIMDGNSEALLWQEIGSSILREPGSLLFLSVIGVYWIYDTIKSYRENGWFKGTYFSVITFVLIIILPYGFIFLTEALAIKAIKLYDTQVKNTLDTLRWFGLFAVLCPLILILTYKKSKFKSLIILCRHLIIFLGGWLLGKWLGMLFLSIPILTIFYWRLYHIAQITFPASNPENLEEKRQKFWVLFWFIWGLQYPIWFATSNATRDTEMRVSGDYFEDLGSPGIVWMHSHQVSGQSVGIEFEKVDGPGILFTEQYERPEAIIDLRTQLRPMPFNALTKDGIEMDAIIFMSFQIDQRSWSDWSKEKRHRILRASPILEKGFELDKTIGSYPYSTARIHSLLGTTSILDADKKQKHPKEYWDEIVAQHIIEKARLVLAERTFDELWFPRQDDIDDIIKDLNENRSPRTDERSKGALDEIAQEIRKRALPRLEEIGVDLFASRVVNYIIDEESPLRKQLIATWLTEWENKINKIRLEANSESERLRVEAQIATRYAFLETIKESLKKARNIDSDLPKQIVALNFIAALQGELRGTDDKNIEQQMAGLEAWKQLLLRGNRGI